MSASIDPTLSTAALASLELAINKALELDLSAQQQLQQLSPNSLNLQCHDLNISLFILLHNGQIQLLQHYEQPCSAVISGPGKAFLELLSSEDKGASLISGELQLQGNSQLLLELQAIMNSLELDWEARLAGVLGDIPAHLIGRSGRHFWQFTQQSGKKFRQHLQDFIVEEARLLPSCPEAENFYQQINELQYRCDRLAARLQKAQQQLAQQNTLK